MKLYHNFTYLAQWSSLTYLNLWLLFSPTQINSFPVYQRRNFHDIVRHRVFRDKDKEKMGRVPRTKMESGRARMRGGITCVRACMRYTLRGFIDPRFCSCTEWRACRRLIVRQTGDGRRRPHRGPGRIGNRNPPHGRPQLGNRSRRP